LKHGPSDAAGAGTHHNPNESAYAMSTARIITLLLLLLFAVAGCSDDDDPATLQGS
jgi:hypothetical protein